MADFPPLTGDPILDLLNTHREGGDDRLRTTDDLLRWMTAANLLPAGGPPPRWNDKADPLLPRVKRLRETVRRELTAAASGRPVSSDVLASLTAAAADAPPAGTSARSPDHLYALLAAAALARLTRPRGSANIGPGDPSS